MPKLEDTLLSRIRAHLPAVSVPAAVLLALVVAAVFSVIYVLGVWPSEGGDVGWADRLERVRNVAIILGGVVALGLAYWRGKTADRQATAAHDQVKRASRQIDLARGQVQAAQEQVRTTLQGQLNQRYEKGSEMLGSDVLAVRIGGIYNLQRLTEEDLAHYYVPIVRLFCAFVRNPPSEATGGDRGTKLRVTLRDDVQTVLDWLGRNRQFTLEDDFGPDHLLNLRGAALRGVSLGEDMDLSRADLSEADLSEARSLDGLNLSWALLSDTRLVNADLTNANLSNAHFAGATCDGLQLDGADVSGAQFSLLGAVPVMGLTQSQLDRAIADTARPPGLRGVQDAETAAPLLWPPGRQS